MKTIYISDLDGTLLQNDATLSPFSRATLQQMLDRGLKFTVASARSVVTIRQTLGDLELSLPVIAFNGAYLSDLQTGHHHEINDIPPARLRALYDLIRRLDRVPIVSSYNGSEERAYFESMNNDGVRWYWDDRVKHGDERVRQMSDLAGTLDERIVCLTVIDRREVVFGLKQKIEEQFETRLEIICFENQYQPGWYWLTIHDRRATKGRATRRLLERQNLHDHELVAFGDQINDVPMFHAADRSYAMQNAVDELKPLATETIGANEEDSVVAFIQQEWESGAGI